MLSSRVCQSITTTSSSSSRRTRHAACSSARLQVSLQQQLHQQRQLGSSSTPAVAAAAAAAAPGRQQQQRHRSITRASTDEEAEIDRMAKAAAGSDVWGNEVVGTLVKVGTVAGVVAFIIVISSLAKPMFDNTIKSFPTPAEYELYEQRESDDAAGGF